MQQFRVDNSITIKLATMNEIDNNNCAHWTDDRKSNQSLQMKLMIVDKIKT